MQQGVTTRDLCMLDLDIVVGSSTDALDGNLPRRTKAHLTDNRLVLHAWRVS
jgi:hypothetical protein